MSKNFKLLLFDLGGVLIEVDTTELKALGKPGQSVVELWETWLTCDAVQRYESGKIGDREFATGVLAAFGSPIEPQTFLASFTRWPIGFYKGTAEFLESLRPRYKLAYLSNSNALHYPRFEHEFRAPQYFDYCFASFKMGAVKPHREIFEKALAMLPFKPEEIFFVDDNRLNIETARSLGIQAEVARGLDEVKQVFAQEKLLE